MGHSSVGSASSSSSSVSSSYLLEVDSDDKLDKTSSKSEENGSSSSSSDPEAPPDTSSPMPNQTMKSASRRAGTPPPTPGLPPTSNLINALPKQSPSVQVMGRPPVYDPNRIPLSVFAPKQTSTEWSVASGESLFSIQTGNNSFSTDRVLLSKSGDLNMSEDWLNFSCFTIDVTKSGNLHTMSSSLPPVVETAENDRKCASTVGEIGEKEELFETRNAAPIDSEREKEKLSASEGIQLSGPNSTVPDGNGANPAEGPRNPASPRLSDESGNSTCSFVFPVVEQGTSMKRDAEKPQQPPPLTPPVPEGEAEAETVSKEPITTPKAGGDTKWFSCFACCPLCRQ